MLHAQLVEGDHPGPDPSGRLRLSVGLACGLLALVLAVSGCSLMPSFGGSSTATPLAVPTPRSVHLGSAGYLVSRFAVLKSGKSLTPLPVAAGSAAVVSYAGVAGTTSITSLSITAPLRVVLIAAGKVVSVHLLRACSVSCPPLAPKRPYDTVVLLPAAAPSPRVGAAAVFS